MWILMAMVVAVLGTFSRTVRELVGGFTFFVCVVVTLLTLYGMTLP